MSKWGNKNGRQFTYVAPQQSSNENKALKYTSAIIKQPFLNINTNILNDYDEIMKDGCIYIPNFFGETNDMTIFKKLKSEIDVNQMVNWSKHQKYENPQFSKTFCEIIDKMAKHFNVKVLQTRMNYYKDSTAFKPMHKDSHAYYTDDNLGYKLLQIVTNCYMLKNTPFYTNYRIFLYLINGREYICILVNFLCIYG